MDAPTLSQVLANDALLRKEYQGKKKKAKKQKAPKLPAPLADARDGL